MTNSTNQTRLRQPHTGACLLFASTARAEKKYETWVSHTEIKPGNFNPYPGPASAYRTRGKAMQAYFAMSPATAG